MTRSRAIAKLLTRKAVEIEANGNYELAEALDVAVQCMEVLESLKSHIRKHGCEQIRDETYGVQVSKSFLETFVFENEKLDFYVNMRGEE